MRMVEARDGEENVAQIDELLVLAGPGLPGAQTHLTGPSHQPHRDTELQLGL